MTDAVTQPTEGTARVDGDGDYQAVVQIDAPSEAVFDALTTAAGLSGWWASASGSGSEGGQLRVVFSGEKARMDSVVLDEEDPLILRVDVARRPSTVAWTVLQCNFLPDWVGTRPSFELTPHATGGCELRFRHQGLTPQLECFASCKAGWEHHLPSLRDYVETGRGRPFGSSSSGTG